MRRAAFIFTGGFDDAGSDLSPLEAHVTRGGPCHGRSSTVAARTCDRRGSKWRQRASSEVSTQRTQHGRFHMQWLLVKCNIRQGLMLQRDRERERKRRSKRKRHFLTFAAWSNSAPLSTALTWTCLPHTFGLTNMQLTTELFLFNWHGTLWLNCVTGGRICVINYGAADDTLSAMPHSDLSVSSLLQPFGMLMS